jgi:hypothetical protein
MFKVTCLVDLRRTVGTSRKFGLEGPRPTVPAQGNTPLPFNHTSYEERE